MVQLRHHLAEERCCLGLPPEDTIEIDRVVARLIAVSILTDQAGYVGRSLGTGQVGGDGEEAVQLGDQPLLTTEAARQPLHILRHEEGVLPRIALAVVIIAVLGGGGVKGGVPLAIAALAPHEAGHRVEEVVVGLAHLEEIGVVLLVPKVLRCFCKGGIGDRILHVVGNALAHLVVGDVAVLAAEILPPFVEEGGPLQFLIDRVRLIAETLHDRISKHTDAGIAHHSIRLIGIEVPDRHLAPFARDRRHRADDVPHAVVMGQGEEWMKGSVGIPEGEGRTGRVARVGVLSEVGTEI